MKWLTVHPVYAGQRNISDVYIFNNVHSRDKVCQYDFMTVQCLDLHEQHKIHPAPG
jgi:hypothetical protein